MDALMFYPERVYAPQFGFSNAENCSDRLLRRIVDFYRDAKADCAIAYGGSLWRGIDDLRASVDSILLSGDLDKVRDALRNPDQHYLLYGFESTFPDHVAALKGDHDRQIAEARWIHDAIARFAEAIGAVRASGPEAPHLEVERTVDAYIAEIESKLGTKLRFPNIFRGEFGVETSRGLASGRAIQALYQAYRINATLGLVGGAKVLEIGAGLGRTAYYASLDGDKRYTIVDLPLSNVAQAFFLGCALGEDRIALGKESLAGRPYDVRILSTGQRYDRDEKYDLVFNADSLPEMDSNVAFGYLDFAFANAKAFLSINHEGQVFTVAQLAAERDYRLFRFPYWMRKGYVEEIGLSFTCGRLH